MPRVQLDIGEGANQLTVRAMLEADGHTVVESHPEVIITDDTLAAIKHSSQAPTLVLATASQLRGAVAAMRQGVYGYIFLPLQPGETEIMVRRAAGAEMPHEHGDRPPEPLAEIEAKHIRYVLRYCKNNRAKAARLLGIGRNTLWRRMREIEAMDRARETD